MIFHFHYIFIICSIITFCVCRPIAPSIPSNSSSFTLSFHQSDFRHRQKSYPPIFLSRPMVFPWTLLCNTLQLPLKPSVPFTRLYRLLLKPYLQEFVGLPSFLLLSKANRKRFSRRLMGSCCFRELQREFHVLLKFGFWFFKLRMVCLRLRDPR